MNHFARRLSVLSALVLGGALAGCTTEPLTTADEVEVSAAGHHVPDGLFTYSDIEQGWSAAQSRGRPLLIMFTSDRCYYCDRMLAETYSDPAVRRLLADHAETVLAHKRDYQDLVRRLKLPGFPTSLVISTDGEIAETIVGYVDAEEFTRRVSPWIGPRSTARLEADAAAGLTL